MESLVFTVSCRADSAVSSKHCQGAACLGAHSYSWLAAGHCCSHSLCKPCYAPSRDADHHHWHPDQAVWVNPSHRRCHLGGASRALSLSALSLLDDLAIGIKLSCSKASIYDRLSCCLRGVPTVAVTRHHPDRAPCCILSLAAPWASTSNKLSVVLIPMVCCCSSMEVLTPRSSPPAVEPLPLSRPLSQRLPSHHPWRDPTQWW